MSQAFCTHCGKAILPGAKFCVHCGQPQPAAMAAAPVPVAPAASGAPAAHTPPASPAQPHLSAHAVASMDVPPGVKGWSWGAFWLNWIWAVFNKTWIGLLALVPVANLVMPFVLGFKGREWAWRKGSWRSVEHFRQVQRKWDIAGWALLGAVVLVMGVAAFVANRPGSSGSARASAEQAQRVHEEISEAIESANVGGAAAPYPLPRVDYSPSQLAAAMVEADIVPRWVQAVQRYASQPERFWQQCLSDEVAYVQRAGGFGIDDAKKWAQEVCEQKVTSLHACLDRQPLQAGVQCIIQYLATIEE